MGIGDIALAREAATAEPSPVRRVRLPLLVAGALDARAEWPIRAGRATLTPYLAAENATSARYSDSLRINAAGGRYFEPAPPLQLRGGISVAIR